MLQDVIRTMYNPKFIEELFRPQDIYTMASTRQIFDRLAHSSIMRLNETSMDKASAATGPPHAPTVHRCAAGGRAAADPPAL